MDKLQSLSRRLLAGEDKSLSRFATPHGSARRARPLEDEDFRSEFARDRDRILYSGAFRRYVGKTQVVYFASQFDEHITNRAIHTIHVSQISRTIGRLLRLNLDLIEAIALGHDLGHPPFGHDGEAILDELCHSYGIGHFLHNVHGLYYVDRIASRNQGLNLTFQVRDGMLFHDGESALESLAPFRSRSERDIGEYIALASAGQRPDWVPSTLEGCVVRMCDTVAYVGQDFEDALRLGLLKKDELPAEIALTLGVSNSRIINSLVCDLVTNSLDHDFVRLSGKVFKAFLGLRDFNQRMIYSHREIRRERDRIAGAFRLMFAHFLDDLENKRTSSIIFKHFLNNRSGEYLAETSPAEKVRDYLATMTDRYFSQVFTGQFVPRMPV
ncbi:MAG: HD domain-containing protein [Candidatus Glassbacteria bacterium]|nr:HD domain-containing protein [Candidatus Glassbacteria bacterium]